MKEIIFLLKLAKEIVSLCKERLAEYSNLETKNFSVEQNTFVINAILREFSEILEYWEASKNLILYSPKLPIGSRWTIIDSAEFDCLKDNELFDKVRNFNELCKSVNPIYIVYKLK